jgi:DNA replication ATP-dependent helicase Dna2
MALYSQKVLFINTDPILEVEETAEEGSLRNDKEAKLVADTIQALVHCGVSPKNLAVVSFYRSQLRLITSTLDPSTKGVELSTVDKYQGRDKDCVIISLVRNNPQGNVSKFIFLSICESNMIIKVGDLLRDWRRLNVAFTRAKSKLILFGSVSTLKLSALYQSLIDLLESKNRVSFYL